MLLALQMLPEVRLLLGSAVAHRAVELSTGSHTHGQVPGDALPRSGVVVWPWRKEVRKELLVVAVKGLLQSRFTYRHS